MGPDVRSQRAEAMSAAKSNPPPSPYGEIRTRSASEGKDRCYEERTKVRSRKTHALGPMDQPTEKKIPHLHPLPLERERRNRAVADVSTNVCSGIRQPRRSSAKAGVGCKSDYDYEHEHEQ